MLLFEVIGVLCAMYSCCLLRVCVLLSKVIGAISLISSCRLPEVCVLLKKLLALFVCCVGDVCPKYVNCCLDFLVLFV